MKRTFLVTLTVEPEADVHYIAEELLEDLNTISYYEVLSVRPWDAHDDSDQSPTPSPNFQ